MNSITDLVGKLQQSLEPIKELVLSNNHDQILAAVMILFIEIDNTWFIVYTRRTNGVSTHQGEVSFPGGGYEAGDRSLVETALRETHEEIGVDAGCIQVIGSLKPMCTISGFFVYPIVGILNCVPCFSVNHEEVERVFTYPVEWLAEPANYYERDYEIEGKPIRKVIHYRDRDGEHLWGLTAKITLDVIDKLK